MKAWSQEGYSNLEFVENKGQWDSRVSLKGQFNSGSIFLLKNGFSILLHNPEELARLRGSHLGRLAVPENIPPSATLRNRPANNGKAGIRTDILHSHVYTVSFKGSSEHAEIVPDKPLPTYDNYFIGNDPSKWASHCRIFLGVTYRNVYPNIDIRYYTNYGQLKYDIIVHPGGDLSKVALQYEGVDKMTLRNNQVSIKTSVGEVKELKPYAYQAGTNGHEQVECRYLLKDDNTLRFEAKNYRTDVPLIIDPTLVFSTFTGSTASNWGFTATPGPDGSFYAGGIVFGDGYKVSPGAFETTFKGGTFDVGIIKFNGTGTNRVYGTYIGGGDNETPHSLFCDPQGNLVVLGRTYSPDFPFLTTVGPQAKGTAKMFVLKLNRDGSGLIGSMRIGGSSDDCVNVRDQFRQENEKAESLIKNYGDDSRSEVILDGANNIYVAGSTQSKDFPHTAGVFQPAFGGGTQDGVVLKINPACNAIIFSSFLGGSAEDAAFVLKLNPANGDIYVAGATASSDFPGNKAGVVQGTYQGGIADAYITIISNDGTVQKRTTFLGTPNFDAIYGIEFDKKGFPYVMGSTKGDWTVTNNVGYVDAGAKQFISKLQPDLSAYVYSTTFGTASNLPNISPVAFLVDRCENVYVSGWGGWLFANEDPYGLSGTLGMRTTPNAIKPNTDGRDFYFMVLKRDATSLLYGTFFGQGDGMKSISEHVDGGTSRYDRFGVIYQAICANCGGNSVTPFKTTPNVWSNVNGTGGNGCNEAAVKIAFNFAGVAADLRSYINGRYDSSGCAPLNALLTDTIHNAKMYLWNFGDGTPDTMTTSNQVNHLYSNIGTYPVRLIAIDSSTCNISDTVYLNIRARNDKADLAFNTAKLPPCQSLTYQFDNVSVPPAGKPFGPNTFTWDFGDGSGPVVASGPTITHTFASPGTYNVALLMLDTSYCNYPDSAQKTLRIAPLVKAQFDVPSGCAPYNAQFNNTSLAGLQFFWDFGDGSTSTDFNPVHLYTDTGTYTIHLTVYDSTTCNKVDSTTRSIIVHAKPQAAFTDQPVPPQTNTPTVFTNNSSASASQFKWL
ncbi:MAG: hypothetical protein C5B59_13620, partial [Bacteroidetes bacterium]